MANSTTAPAVRYLQNYGTGTATTLAAAQFGPSEAMLGTDEVEEGPMGIGVAELYAGTVEIELERRARVCRFYELLEGIIRALGHGDDDIRFCDRSRKHHPRRISLQSNWEERRLSLAILQGREKEITLKSH
jgi:hypothetical protein